MFIRLAIDGAEDLKIHTGLGSRFYKGSPWYRYLGVGDLISVANAVDTSATSARAMTFSMTLPNTEDARRQRIDLIKAAREEDLIDNDVAVYLWEEGIQKEPQLVTLAKVETLTVASTQITISAQTAAANLDRVHHAATLHTDLQQRQIVDATDRGLRFANQEYADAGITYP